MFVAQDTLIWANEEYLQKMLKSVQKGLPKPRPLILSYDTLLNFSTMKLMSSLKNSTRKQPGILKKLAKVQPMMPSNKQYCKIIMFILIFWKQPQSHRNCWKCSHLFFSRDPSILAECGLDEKTQEVLLSNIKRKLTSQAVKIRSDFEVACYGYEGIDAVKTALRAGLACSTEELPIRINLIAPPLYGEFRSTKLCEPSISQPRIIFYMAELFSIFPFVVMTTSTPEKADGLKALNTAIEKIEEKIGTLGGIFTMRMAVCIFSNTSLFKLVSRSIRLNQIQLLGSISLCHKNFENENNRGKKKLLIWKGGSLYVLFWIALFPSLLKCKVISYPCFI